MKNSWNQWIYKCWAPVYERIFNSGMFLKARQKVFEDLPIEKGSRILFIGVGTGADLPYFINKGYEITAIDFSTEMLNVAKRKFENKSVTFYKMDAQQLEFNDQSFDFVVASLVVSVVPDPIKALNEGVRVLKQNGSLIVFDKFIPKNKQSTLKQKVLRPIIKWLGTDIGLDFYDLYRNVEIQLEIIKDEEIMMNGLYRKIYAMKKGKLS
ncbi:class I SAM-dependent methyltransferase [Litchfieldia salsa]|uniref:Ubiquinone/menaquinone biosynthesis C-methylase UbiE n=1 Tax=Litchfieldia salsa TaxID=930152 RepID=A0A1H0PCU7_9BACI|nr:class I SAM-dependent methyltransferase [Litchfieldia salsa]SDP02814.1 Ubiquinone/menaquinone biosynthesis C-methylase UbiE [Litchfieldia salsa]